jgi:dihydroorotate dehydrogenase
MPNLQPVDVGPLRGGEREVPASPAMRGTWAVAFGMPSMSPDTWRRDVAWTRDRLAAEKRLCVSVVGTLQPGWTLRDLADDYACCARWAVDSGADAVEMNFSCPNVCTVDGQLYQQPRDAALVAEHVRGAVGNVPLLAKIGHVTDPEAADRLLAALAPHVAGLAMTNSVAATVRAPEGSLLFGGEPRGLCGDATRAASVAQTRLFREAGVRLGHCPALIGVGGVSRAEHVREYLAAGAECVHVATAAMTDPLVACRIRAALAESA